MSALKIIPGEKISGTVDIPGSKSYTNRSLIIASLIDGEVRIINPLYSDDTIAMIKCLKDLGVEILENKSEIHVKGSVKDIKNREFKLNANLSGTTIRFILALSCVIPGIKIITGEGSLLERPIGELAGALKDLGAKIEYLGKPGYPPLKVSSSELTVKKTRLHGDISSQFFSALLMIAPLTQGLEIDVMGKSISTPYIDMTIDLMKYFGVNVRNVDYRNYIVDTGQKYLQKDYTVEGDYSSAGYFLAIAALTKSKLTLNNLSEKSLQADRNFIEILEKLGNKIIFKANSLQVSGNGVKPINIDMENCPDQAQTLAVILSFAKGKSVITGIRSLRIKETERILALQNELSKMGIKTESTIDSLTIYGGNPKPAEINTYNDHRMAMSFSVAGTVIEGMVIKNPEVVSKTFPGLLEKARVLELKLMINKIFLVGFRTTGKSTLGKILAEKINWSFLDTDFLITQEAGEEVDIITKKGSDWSRFRTLENEVLKDLAGMKNIVISCGGGVGVNDVIDTQSKKTFGDLNKETLKKMDNALVILLTSKDKTIEHRLYRKFMNKKVMPLLNGGDLEPGASEEEQIKHQVKDSMKALEKRKSLYEDLADIEIDTSDFRIPRRLVNLNVVIGDPIAQSLSAKMHNAGYKALDIDDANLFIPLKVAPEKLDKFMSIVKILDIKGISVTIPHKETIFDYLDELDETARYIGAVNTVIYKEGKLKGYNTDWIGAVSALEKKTQLKGKRVAVFGGGGAAKAIAYGLVQKQALVTLFNRNLDKARDLAKKFNVEYKSLENLETVKNTDIIINCTSVGMYDDASLVPEELINKNQIIFDIITTPKETRLIKNAKSKNAAVVYGYEMLLYQGVEQFKLYTGFEPPVKEMEEAIKNV